MGTLQILDQLESSDIIRPVQGADVEYSFKHALVQETAYHSLLLKNRRKIHLDVAQVYEQLYPERLDELAAILAEHYAEAGDDDKTVEYETRAGAAAARVFAHAEAIAHYTRALEIAKQMPHSPESTGNGSGRGHVLQDLYLKRGRALEVSGQYEHALHNYEEMRALARERGDEGLELEGLMASATLHSIPGPANSTLHARGLSTQALALAQELGNRAAEAKIYWNLMLLENWGGSEPQRAIEYGEKSHAIAREFGLREQLAFTLHDLSMSYMLAGQMERAWKTQQEAAALWREFNNATMIAESLNRNALILHLDADFPGAISSAGEAHRLAQSSGNLVGEALSSFNLSHAYWALGQPALAIEYGWNCHRRSTEAEIGNMGLGIQSELAWMYGWLGQIERGVELARHGANQVSTATLGEDESPLELWNAIFAATSIRLELLRGNLTGAQEILRKNKLAIPTGFVGVTSLDVSTVFMAIGELKLAEGDYQAARDAMDALMAAMKRMPVRPFLPAAIHLKAKIQAAQGLAPAIETMRSARAEAEATNHRPILQQILVDLGNMSSQLGDHAEEAELRRQARAVVHYIAEHATDELRASFLTAPWVKKVVDGA